MPEGKPEQLQQAPAGLLAAQLQGPDSHMLGGLTICPLDSTLFQGMSSPEVPCRIAASHPSV